MIAYLDGRWVDADTACIPIADRGFLLGDGVFETARLHRGHFYRFDDHLGRLRTSGALLRIPIPPDAALTEIARELVRRNDLTEGSLRITLTRGAGARAGTLLATLAPIAADWQAKAERGWRVITAATRRPPVSAVPAELKGIGRPYALLARLEAEDAGVDDALLLSHDGFITEGPTWNVFWRHDNRICTPALSVGVLGGITRATVLDAAAARGYEVAEGAWTPAALATADEIFATMSSVGIVSVRQMDGRALPSASPAAETLQRDYWARVAEAGAGE
jgi:branched-chain amino acid aminotransferase